MSSIQSKALLVNLSISKFSPRKTDKKVTAEVLEKHEAAGDAGKFIKALLPEKALDAIKDIETKVREYHYEHSLPWADTGARILPSPHYLDYNERMRSFRAKFEAAVSTFIDNYDDYVAQAKQRLNGMFNPADYPDKTDLVGRFVFKLSFLPLPSGEDFRVDLQKEELDQLRVEVDARMLEAAEHARVDLWQRLAAPLKAMVERLSDPAHKFKDSLVGNLKDIVSLIPVLNITQDQTLESLRREVEQLGLTDLQPEILRKDTAVREKAAHQAQAILDKMNAYLSPQAIAA